MKELLTIIDEYINHTNDLTREMDSYLTINHEYGATYIHENPISSRWAIRYPGATRGHIEVDQDNIITGIELYDDGYHTDSIYKPEVRDCFIKYIGMKLVMVK